MASVETIVALLRNGLCVAVDTLPRNHRLKLPLKALLFEYAASGELSSWADWLKKTGTFEELSVLSVFIAFLQLCAVGFNCVGAMLLPSTIAEYRRLRLLEGQSMKSRSRIVEVGSTLAVRRATSKVAFAVVRLLLAPSFAVLAFYTLRLASQRLLEWALLLMQIALAIALDAMWRELAYRRRKAANATVVASTPATDDPELLAALDEIPVGSDSLVAIVSEASAGPCVPLDSM